MRVLPTRWRQKSTGIDMKQSYVTVTLCRLLSTKVVDGRACWPHLRRSTCRVCLDHYYSVTLGKVEHVLVENNLLNCGFICASTRVNIYCKRRFSIGRLYCNFADSKFFLCDFIHEVSYQASGGRSNFCIAHTTEDVVREKTSQS